MLTDQDRAWLVALNEDLWPEDETKRTKRTIVLDASRKLLHEELDRICALIESAPLLTSMFSKGMFGGFGMLVYEHSAYPHVPPQQLLCLTEDHLPPPKGPSVYEHLTGTAKPLPPEKKPAPGCGTDQGWEAFSKYTHSERNREWLKNYNMKAPQERHYYDY
jgi:hypothetical protein